MSEVDKPFSMAQGHLRRKLKAIKNKENSSLHPDSDVGAVSRTELVTLHLRHCFSYSFNPLCL
jgi:hypothetical protein